MGFLTQFLTTDLILIYDYYYAGWYTELCCAGHYRSAQQKTPVLSLCEVTNGWHQTAFIRE